MPVQYDVALVGNCATATEAGIDGFVESHHVGPDRTNLVVIECVPYGVDYSIRIVRR
jgi:hypothetical protein